MPSLSRRSFVASAFALAAVAVSGCQIDTGSSSSKQSGGTASVEFPTYRGGVESSGTLRWLDSGDLKSVYEKAVLDAFSTKNPAIRTDYQGTGWETVRQVLSLGIRNNSAPDVFGLPTDIPAQTAISEGWVRPLDDLIPDFDSWKSDFPDGGLVPGVHVFNGKTYTFPLNSARRLPHMLFLDTKNLKAAGYDDPAKQITTWEDVHTALTKVVRTGKSGLMLGRDVIGDTVQSLATTLGWRGSLNGWAGMDMKAGKFIYDAPEVLEAFEFLQRLVKDKLVVSDYLTLVDKDARTRFASGNTGIMFVGPFSLPAWKKQAPNWKVSVAQLPSSSGDDYVVPFAEVGANSPWVYAKTKLPRSVGQVLRYMGSREGQKQLVVLSQGNLESIQQQANTAAGRDNVLDPTAKICSQLAHKIMHAAPQVEIRNPDVSAVRLALKPVTPVWDDLMQGLFTGDLTNPRAQFAKYNASLEKALDTAITAARKKGAQISRDDFAFANWNPQKEYTAADYKALG